MSSWRHFIASVASGVTFLFGLSIMFKWADNSNDWLGYLGSVLTIIGLFWTIKVEMIYCIRNIKVEIEDRR